MRCFHCEINFGQPQRIVCNTNIIIIIIIHLTNSRYLYYFYLELTRAQVLPIENAMRFTLLSEYIFCIGYDRHWHVVGTCSGIAVRQLAARLRKICGKNCAESFNYRSCSNLYGNYFSYIP